MVNILIPIALVWHLRKYETHTRSTRRSIVHHAHIFLVPNYYSALSAGSQSMRFLPASLLRLLASQSLCCFGWGLLVSSLLVPHSDQLLCQHIVAFVGTPNFLGWIYDITVVVNLVIRECRDSYRGSYTHSKLK